MSDIIATRTKGALPVSIGTAMALEVFFGISTEKPLSPKEKAPYLTHECLCLNIRTLIRNLLSSIKSADIEKVNKYEIRKALIEEMGLIVNIVKEHTQNKCVCVFYFNTYAHVKKVYKAANFKQNYSPKQAYQQDMETDIGTSVFVKGAIQNKEINLHYTTDKISHGKRTNTLLTHYPIDLLENKFTHFSLLESHTGKVKANHEFNSKLKNAPRECPFNKVTIQLYGDSSGMFQPNDSEVRKEVTELIHKHHVSTVTHYTSFIKMLRHYGSSQTKSFVSKAV